MLYSEKIQADLCIEIMSNINKTLKDNYALVDTATLTTLANNLRQATFSLNPQPDIQVIRKISEAVSLLRTTKTFNDKGDMVTYEVGHLLIGGYQLEFGTSEHYFDEENQIQTYGNDGDFHIDAPFVVIVVKYRESERDEVDAADEIDRRLIFYVPETSVDNKTYRSADFEKVCNLS